MPIHLRCVGCGDVAHFGFGCSTNGPEGFWFCSACRPQTDAELRAVIDRAKHQGKADEGLGVRPEQQHDGFRDR